MQGPRFCAEPLIDSAIRQNGSFSSDCVRAVLKERRYSCSYPFLSGEKAPRPGAMHSCNQRLVRMPVRVADCMLVFLFKFCASSSYPPSTPYAHVQFLYLAQKAENSLIYLDDENRQRYNRITLGKRNREKWLTEDCFQWYTHFRRRERAQAASSKRRASSE